VHLSYQSVTQWYEGGEAGLWNQVEANASLGRGTTLRVAAKVPDVTDTRYLLMRLDQALPKHFSVSFEVGAIAAFHPRTLTAPTGSRVLLMLRRTFDVATPASGGHVTGTVVDDAGRPVPPTTVRLGNYMTQTRENGRFDFGTVPVGTFTLEVDAARLDANYLSSTPATSIAVTRGSSSTFELEVTRLASVSGLVYLDANLNNRPDAGEGLAGIVVVLDGRLTTTDESGRYRFFNLPDGEYRVVLDTTRLRRDLEAASPTETSVVLENGRAGLAADFRVLRKDRRTIMQEAVQ
jgi:Carboxypeptidase regulatory-like domain/SdrD B-like domain